MRSVRLGKRVLGALRQEHYSLLCFGEGTVLTSLDRKLAECRRCSAARATRKEPHLVGSSAPLWLRTVFRRMQLRRGVSENLSSVQLTAAVERMRSEDATLSLDQLAVVCCYYNPCGYRSRSENYRRFAESLARSGVKLLTVELAIGEGKHELPEVYGQTLRVRSDALLWHKERLLNLGIQRLLQDGYQQIVWLDADVEFAAAELWPWFVVSALRQAPLCQAFSRLVADSGQRMIPAISAARYFAMYGAVLDQPTRAPSFGHPFGVAMGMPGYGWAARAEVLEKCQLYDKAIVGGGDKLIFAASVCDQTSRGELRRFVESPYQRCTSCGEETSPTPSLVGDLDEWSTRWFGAVGGKVSAAELEMKVMFHGVWSKRRYWLRQEILAKYEYDPATDLQLNEHGCWEWSSDKPALHAQVANYFRARDEDAS